MDRISGIHMEGLYVDHEQQVAVRHHLSRRITRLQTVEGVGTATMEVKLAQ